MKSFKEVVAVTQNYLNTNVRVARLQFLCIGSRLFLTSAKENGSNGRETQLCTLCEIKHHTVGNKAFSVLQYCCHS